MPPVLKNVILLTVVVLALGGAAWYTYSKHGEDVIPDDPNVTTHWMCETCGWNTSLTERKLEEWRQTPGKLRRDPTQVLSKQMVFLCPTCNTHTVVGALQCKTHKTWYCAISSKGQKLDCPQCAKEQRK